MILILGTPDSGKSVLAEKIMSDDGADGDLKKAYIATMEPFGEEGIKRIERHRKQREGKGFVTFEKNVGVDELLPDFIAENINAALLECVSNLVGNEIYKKENADKNDETLTNLICEEIMALDEFLDKYVVVTNDFDFDASYDEETRKYIRITKLVNRVLEERAEKVYFLNK